MTKQSSNKQASKRIARMVFRVLWLPFYPFMALGWWANSDDSYLESLKGVWK